MSPAIVSYIITGSFMSSRISLYVATAVFALAFIGCGGARKQTSVEPEAIASVSEPAITFGTVAEIASGPVQVTTNPSNNGLGSYHPDGSKIVFQSDRDGRWQLYQLDPVAGTEELLIGSDANDENPMWLPDSSGVVFVSDRIHPDEEYARDIFFFDPVAIQTATLTEEAADDWYPVPVNSDSYYFLSEREAPAGQAPFEVANCLYRGSFDGTPATLVAGIEVNPSAPADLEDGSLLVRTNSGQLAQLSADGKLDPLTPMSLMCGTASYSHTRKIATLNAREGEVYQLYLFNLATRTLQLVETGEGDVRYPQFSPDGNKILYSKEIDGNFQLFQLELAQ